MTRLDKEKIAASFRDLRKLGYFCRMNFWCCQSCAWYDIPEEKANKAVFYHKQDAEAFKKKEKSMYLAWHGDAKEICNILSQHGLSVELPKDENTRILLKSGMEMERNYL